VEPPIGIEPMTYALRETRSLPAHALAAPTAQEIALVALAALGLSGEPVHEPVHARSPASPAILLLCVSVAATKCIGAPQADGAAADALSLCHYAHSPVSRRPDLPHIARELQRVLPGPVRRSAS